MAALFLIAISAYITSARADFHSNQRARPAIRPPSAAPVDMPMNMNSDIRGRLQSHGIAGVQARHYDEHDYFDEKLESLEKVYTLLEKPFSDTQRAKSG
ncbi:hypothetical protein OIN59_19715 [Acidovorax sp. D2M1]|uniref:DUF4148 domain-containing protein n=1 Tax=Acidovorax benzenivorans TaxID=2987520 RepID=A0ABT5S140_9BURK|nr:hypothetical protein [Acidovorax benzenivorans]MDD2179673.1 hypothetical protein [Acidovorax benzenivorans]